MCLFCSAGEYTSSLTRTYMSPCRVVYVSNNVTGAEKMVSSSLSGPQSGQAVLSARNIMVMESGSYVIFDFGKEIHGGIRITAGATTARIRVRFGESVSETCSQIGEDGATNDHAIRDFEMQLPWYGVRETGNSGFRFVRIDMVDSLPAAQIRSVDAIRVESVYPQIGRFHSSDSLLNTIWETGRHTVKLNMQDYLWDGIKRDRLVWIGDMYPEVMTICSVYGNVDVVPRSLDFATADYPLPSWINGISSYSIWWILIQYQWYLHIGNKDYLRTQKPYLSGLIRQLYDNIGDDNREHLSGNRFLDWPSNGDPNAVSTGLHALMLMAFDCAGELSSVLGDAESEKLCRDGYARLNTSSQAVCDAFFAEKINPDRVGRKQALALMSLAGMIPSDDAADALLFNRSHGFSTFYGSYMLEALAKAGRHDNAISIIKEYWGGMIKLGATSFWEDFDIDWMENAGRIDEMPITGKVDVHRTYGGYCYKGLRHSLCHGWASGPTSWITRHVLGLRPGNAGQDTLILDPHLCGLSWAEGSYPTPKGEVKIKLSPLGDGKVMARVDAPAGIEIKPSDRTVLQRSSY